MNPDLRSYDVLLLNSSAGKDSQAMLDYVVDVATDAGVRDRIVVVHCDLGEMEWPGTRELAEEQAGHYGLRFEVVHNRGWADLLARIEARGKWPDANNRYCTSEFKTNQAKRLTTQLVREVRASGVHRQVRVLNMLGLRAQESPARAKRESFRHYEPKSGWTNGVRWVDEWLPIHDWTVDQVWARIRQSGVRHHYAYDEGMPRLSCRFCVFASRGALVRSAQLNPELAERYVAAEARMGHRFTFNLSIAEVVEQAKAETVDTIDDWAA